MEESCEHHSTHVCDCSSKPSLYTQSLTEMDFERGIWQAALDNNVKRITTILDKGGDPDARDGSGYTALVRKLIVVDIFLALILGPFCCSVVEMKWHTSLPVSVLYPIPRPPPLLCRPFHMFFICFHILSSIRLVNGHLLCVVRGLD